MVEEGEQNMRITHKTMHNNMLRNLNSGLRRMDTHQRQLASGKRVQLPSDDPAVVGSILGRKTSIAETRQYVKNLDDAISWLDATDSAFDSVTSVIHRVRELTVYGANDALGEEDRQALASEVRELAENILELANVSVGGRYVFAGQKTQTRPFVKADDADPFSAEYQGANAEHVDVRLEVGVGTEMAINLMDVDEEGNEGIFLPLFESLEAIHDNLTDGDPRELGNQNLADLDAALDTVLRYRAEAGAKANRLKMGRERLLDLELNLVQLLSGDQDVDVAEAIMHLKAEESVYRTALSVGARIIQPSLVDFLR